MTELSQLWTIFSFINLGKKWHSSMQRHEDQRSTTQLRSVQYDRTGYGYRTDYGFGAWLSLAINEWLQCN